MKKLILYIFLYFFIASCFAQNIPRPNIAAPMGLEINSFTGNLFYPRADITLRGVGFPVYGAFYYNSSADSSNYGFGFGWTFYYNIFYKDQGTSVIIQHGDAKTDSFALVNGSYKSPEGVYDVLTKAGSAFILTTKEGIKYFFANASHRKLTSITDPNGNAINLVYTSVFVSIIRNSSGRTLQLTWNNGLLQSIQDSALPAKKFSYQYDANGDLVKVINPLNQSKEFAYSNHAMIKVSDEKQNPVVIEYSSGSLVKSINSCNSTITISINRASLQTTTSGQTGVLVLPQTTYVSQKSAAGKLVTIYNFDHKGRIYSVTNADNKKSFFNYDNNNNLVEWKNWNGKPLKFTYDTKGNILTETDALNYKTTYTYEAVYNKVTSIKDKRGKTTALTYDTKGNLQKIVKPGGITESYDYYSNGNLKTYTNANGKPTGYEYNSNGDLIKINYPIGTKKFEYSGSCCNLSKITDANGQSLNMTYDLMNRITSVSEDLNHSIQYHYDATGNMDRETDANNHTKYYTYNQDNRLTAVTLPSAGTWLYDYDGVGNLTKLTDANSHLTRYEYDKLNRLLAETDPVNHTTSYTYDANGNVSSKKFPNGNTISYRYDELDRLTEKTYPGNTDKFSYYANGNLYSAYNNNITYTFEYDDLERLTKKNIPTWGKSIGYSYDSAGNRHTMTDHDGGTYTYAYNGNNQLISLINAFNLTTQFQYDLGGRLTKQVNANNTYTNYSYDNAGRIDSIENKRTNGQMISNFYYTFDSLGNRKTLKDKYGLNKYDYDSSYRLTKVQYANGDTETYKIDATGNRTQKIKKGIATPYTYNNADQIQTAGASTFVFDENGNTKQQTDSIQKKFDYDGENRLVQATINSRKTVQYLYDPFGNKIQRTDTNGIVTKMVYDYENLLAELDANNITIAKYTTALDIDSWLGMNINGNNYFYQRDGLNSVVQLTGNTGLTVNDYNYDVYGNILSQVSGVNNAVTYTGRIWENNIGLFEYRSRFYSSQVGRFLNKDVFQPSIFNSLQSNKYNYVQNNPSNFIDPKGKFIAPFLGGATFAIISNILHQLYNGKEICWREVFISGLVGGIGGVGLDFGLKKIGVISEFSSFFEELKFQFWDKEILSSHLLSDIPSVAKKAGIFDKAFDVIYNKGFLIGGWYGNYRAEKFAEDEVSSLISCGKDRPDATGADKALGDLVRNIFDFFIKLIKPYDPNEIVGPIGYDSTKQWVSSNSALPYKVSFTNNDSTANSACTKSYYYFAYTS